MDFDYTVKCDDEKIPGEGMREMQGEMRDASGRGGGGGCNGSGWCAMNKIPGREVELAMHGGIETSILTGRHIAPNIRKSKYRRFSGALSGTKIGHQA